MEKHPLGNWRCHKEGSQQDWFLTDHWSDWVTVGHPWHLVLLPFSISQSHSLPWVSQSSMLGARPSHRCLPLRADRVNTCFSVSAFPLAMGCEKGARDQRMGKAPKSPNPCRARPPGGRGWESWQTQEGCVSVIELKHSPFQVIEAALASGSRGHNLNLHA